MSLLAALPKGLKIGCPQQGTLADVLYQNGMDLPLQLRLGNITLGQAAQPDVGFLFDVAASNTGKLAFWLTDGRRFGTGPKALVLRRDGLGKWVSSPTVTCHPPNQVSPTQFQTVPGSSHVLVGNTKTHDMPRATTGIQWFRNRGHTENVAIQDILSSGVPTVFSRSQRAPGNTVAGVV